MSPRNPKDAQIAEAKYRGGSGLQQDVLRAQVQLTTLLQEQIRREAAILRAEAALAAVLDLPPGTRLPRTTELADAAHHLEGNAAGEIASGLPTVDSEQFAMTQHSGQSLFQAHRECAQSWVR